MNFSYYYGNAADVYSFYRIPKELLLGGTYAELSIEAKLLYGMLMDRMGMSVKNRWIDEDDRVFVIYPISEIQEDMSISKKKAMEYLSELVDFGLVMKKVRGLGQPSLLYPMNFIPE